MIYSVPLEQVSCVYLFGNVGKLGRGAVGQDGAGEALELGKVVDHPAAEEGGAVFKRRLIDDHGGPLGLDALHHALYGGLAEVVGVGLHRQAVHPDDAFLLRGGAVGVVGAVIIVAGHLQDLVGYEVLAGAVALDYGRHHVLGDVGVVGKELLGVLGQAVAAVAEGGVVVVAAYAGVEAYAADYGLGVEPLDLGVGVKLVEVADAEGQIGVGEELDGLGLLHAHVEDGDVLADGALAEEAGEGAGRRVEPADVGEAHYGVVLHGEARILHDAGDAGDDARGVKVVIQGLALAEELGEEEEVEPPGPARGVPHVERPAVADGDGGLYDHHGVGVDVEHEVYDLLHARCVEVVPDGVVVGRGRDDHEVGVAVGRSPVERGREVERLFGEVSLYVLVLYGRPAAVYEFNLFGDDVDGRDAVVLREEGRYAESDVAGSGNGDIVFFHI